MTDLLPFPDQPADVPWPTEAWPTVEPSAVGGLDAERLAVLVDEALADPEPTVMGHTDALLVVHRGRLVGRLDAKAHRQAGLFQVLGLWLEADVAATPALVEDVAEAIGECAAWHGTPRVVIEGSRPRTLAGLLTKALAG